jgi:hypothetical protein
MPCGSYDPVASVLQHWKVARLKTVVKKKAYQTHGYGLKGISLESICELNEILFIGCEAVYSTTNCLNPLISEA